MDEEPYSPMFYFALLVGLIGLVGFILTAAVYGGF